MLHKGEPEGERERALAPHHHSLIQEATVLMSLWLFSCLGPAYKIDVTFWTKIAPPEPLY